MKARGGRAHGSTRRRGEGERRFAGGVFFRGVAGFPRLMGQLGPQTLARQAKAEVLLNLIGCCFIFRYVSIY